MNVFNVNRIFLIAAQNSAEIGKPPGKSHQKMFRSIKRFAVLAFGVGGVSVCGAARAADAASVQSVTMDRALVWAGFDIEGATAIAREDLERAYSAEVGAPQNSPALSTIADRITEIYRGRGYFLSRAIVPQQPLADFGIGCIVVVEGRIDAVTFEGVERPLARAAFDEIARLGPARLPDLRRAIARARDLPGLSVSTRIVPDPNDAARNTLVVRIEPSEVTASLWIDVASTYADRPWAVTAAVTRGGGGGLPDRSGFWLRRPGQASDGAAGFGVFGSSALTADVTLDARADAFTAPGNVDGGGAAVRVTRRLARSEFAGVWGGGEIEARTMRREATTDDVSARVFIRGRLDSAGRSSGFVALATVGERRERIGSGEDTGSFAKIEGEVWGRLPLRLGIKLEATLLAQAGLESLPEAEQVWFGGDRLGRGLEKGWASGDHALALSAQASRSIPFLNDRASMTPYAFIDAAHLRTIATPNDAGTFVTAGLGARLDLLDRVAVEAEIAQPIHTDDANVASRPQHRVSVSLSY